MPCTSRWRRSATGPQEDNLDASELTLPPVRGTLTTARPMADITWLRVGGPADVFFQPADEADLRLPSGPAGRRAGAAVGVGSNLIVRDGGIPGVVIRLGRGFNGIARRRRPGGAGAAALDAHVARRAAEAGVDLTFLRTIPGSVGGAAKMNAGCYGSYTADVLVRAGRDPGGGAGDADPGGHGLRYRSTTLPDGLVVTEVTLQGPRGAPEALARRMEEQLAQRDASQPVRARTAGSTFRNPAGFSSTGRADDVHDLKAWKLIEDAGMRGAMLGGAQMSPMHANFLVNTGGAKAADLEGLGELVRKKGFGFKRSVARVGNHAVGRP